MAVPAFRAAGSVVFAPNNIVNPTALAVVAPAGRSVGDLLLLVTQCRSIVATCATPTGYGAGPLTGFPVRHGTANGGSIYVFARIADGTAADSVTATWSSIGNTGTSGDSSSAYIIAVQNARNVQAGTVTSTAATSTTTVTYPAITTTQGNAYILGVLIRVVDASHTYTVATRTERVDSSTQNGTGHGVCAGDIVQTSVGASATSVATPSTSTSSLTVAVTLAMAGTVSTVAVGQATETDTARRLAVPINRVTETETAQVTGRLHTRAVAQATETDTQGRIGSGGFPNATYSSVFTDDFNRANQSPPGGSWSTTRISAGTTTTLSVSSNQLVGTGDAYITGLTRTDLEVVADVVTVGGGSQNISVRVLSPGASSDLYQVLWSGSLTSLRKLTGGGASLNTIDSTLELIQAGDRVGLRVVGTLLEVRRYRDGVWQRLLVATDSDVSGAGGVGVALGASAAIDNLVVYVPVPLSATVNQATETDTAGALTRTKRLAIGQATSTETAGVLTPVLTGGTPQTIAVAQATDTETARAVTATKLKAIAQATDTETARTMIVVDPILRAIAQASDAESAAALTHLKIRAIAQATEADTARTLIVVDPILRAIAQASETETAQTITRVKTKAIAQATESDTARTLIVVDPILRAIAQASDTGTAQALTHLKTLAVGQASETETSRTLVIVDPILRAIAQASDTETAGATTATKLKAIGQASDAETAGAVTFSKRKLIAQASDTETARELTAASGRTVLRASEEDTASAVAALKVKLLAQASDTSSANALAHSRGATAGQASETNTAAVASAFKAKAIAIASTAELASAVTVRGRAAQVADTSSAGAITHLKLLGIQPASQTDSAGAVSVTRLVSAGIAFEVDATGTLAILKFKASAPATETDLSQPMAPPPPQFADVGIALETDTARAIGSGGLRVRITTGTVVRAVTGTSGVIVRVSDEIREGRVTRPPVPTTGLAVTLAPGSD